MNHLEFVLLKLSTEPSKDEIIFLSDGFIHIQQTFHCKTNYYLNLLSIFLIEYNDLILHQDPGNSHWRVTQGDTYDMAE